MRIQLSKTVIGGLLGCGMAVTGAVNAQEVSLEQAVTHLLINQSQQVVTELSQQLKQSIAHELSQFSIDVSGQALVDQNEQLETASQQKVQSTQNSKNKTAAE